MHVDFPGRANLSFLDAYVSLVAILYLQSMIVRLGVRIILSGL